MECEREGKKEGEKELDKWSERKREYYFGNHLQRMVISLQQPKWFHFPPGPHILFSQVHRPRNRKSVEVRK